ncbi:MAG: InlB B-repeat-containing protein, partial [Lachnospiraceae bacterium]|nr:InlB B-repeat-containing protein [Lachnospiraceae bacterium]
KPTDPEEEGYTFGGWFTDAECTNAYDFDTKVTDHMTLYAKWTANPEETTYTVTFHTNGHGTAPDSQTVSENGRAQKPTDPEAKGYAFGGWFTDTKCTNVYDFNTEVTADITLYAKWTANHATTGEDADSVSPQAEKYVFDPADPQALVAKTKADISPAFEKIMDSPDYDPGARHRYVSKNKKVARVNKNGILTPKDTGLVEIVLEQRKNGSQWTQIGEGLELYVQKPQMKKIDTRKVSDASFSAYEYLSKTTYSPTRWISTKPNVARVDINGKITIYENGSTDIIALYGAGGSSSKKKYKTRIKVQK